MAAASPAEVTLVAATLDTVQVKGRRRSQRQAQRLIGDRGYDSNPLRAWLLARDIEPIIPARSNNRVATQQDGRKLRRFRHRWIIERTTSWLQNFRRLVVRYEHKSKNFIALVQLACSLITLRKLSG